MSSVKKSKPFCSSLNILEDTHFNNQRIFSTKNEIKRMYASRKSFLLMNTTKILTGVSGQWALKGEKIKYNNNIH